MTWKPSFAERGQVVIPKAIRDQLGLTPGTLLNFTVGVASSSFAKKLDDAFSRARGILKLEPRNGGRHHDASFAGRAQRSHRAVGGAA